MLQTIGTISLMLPPLGQDGYAKLEAWLRSVCWETTLPSTTLRASVSGVGDNIEVHRIKGRIIVTDGRTFMLQGVREVFELVDTSEHSGGGSREASALNREGKIVVIGRGLEADVWQASLSNCVAGHSAL